MHVEVRFSPGGLSDIEDLLAERGIIIFSTWVGTWSGLHIIGISGQVRLLNRAGSGVRPDGSTQRS